MSSRTTDGLKQVKKVESPYARGNRERISKDRHTALVALELRTTDSKEATKLDKPVEKAIIAANARHPGIAIEEFGVNVETQLDEAVKSDFTKAGVFSLPVTLIVLVVAFGALIAAGLPLLLALTAVLATMGLLALPSHLIPLDQDVSVIVLLIGLAVGVDYSIFYLKREREERAAGRSERAALEAAAATSGRSVLVSGLTVMVAMAGMLFTGDKTFMGFGVATMIVVAIAVLGSLTVLPATLAALGDKVEKLRVPFLHRRTPLRGQRPGVERDPRSRPAPPARLGRPRRRAPARARRTGAAPAHRRARHQDIPAEPVLDQDLQQAAEGVPRRGRTRPRCSSRPTTPTAPRSRRRSPT